jgi:TIR domain
MRPTNPNRVVALMSGSPPVVEDAPGLVLRRSKNGWTATWQARTDLVVRGFTPKWQKLCLITDEPTKTERAWISDRCRVLQAEMLAWATHFTSATAEGEGTEDSVARAMIRDVFVSHAFEDKDEIARQLVEALVARGISVWFDEYELRLGDSIRKKIEQGLRDSRHGLIIMTKNFFNREWTQKELSALEASGKRVMPVWHGITAQDVQTFLQFSLIATRFLQVAVLTPSLTK